MKQFVILILLAGGIFMQAQNLNKSDSALTLKLKTLAHEGYFQFSDAKFKELSALCERALSLNSSDYTALYYRAYAHYRLMNIGMAKSNESHFNQYFASVQESCGQLIKTGKNISEAKVLTAAANMMILTKDLSEAPAISMKIHQLLSEAESSDPQNPRVNIIRGTMLLNTPPAFGGSAVSAAAEFKKALDKFSDEKSDGDITWGKAEASAWLGIAQMKQGKLDDAKETFETALNEFPDFGWVKYQLLPQLQKQTKGAEK